MNSHDIFYDLCLEELAYLKILKWFPNSNSTLNSAQDTRIKYIFWDITSFSIFLV